MEKHTQTRKDICSYFWCHGWNLHWGSSGISALLAVLQLEVLVPFFKPNQGIFLQTCDQPATYRLNFQCASVTPEESSLGLEEGSCHPITCGHGNFFQPVLQSRDLGSCKGGDLPSSSANCQCHALGMCPEACSARGAGKEGGARHTQHTLGEVRSRVTLLCLLQMLK